MIRGTTPTYTFTIQSQTLDLTEAQNVYVTFEQTRSGKTTHIEKTGEDLVVEAKKVSVFLSQEESLKLHEQAAAEVQINWTYLDPLDPTIVRRAATVVKTIPILKQLMGRVVT